MTTIKALNPARWLRHVFTTPLALRRSFPAESLTRLGQAIAQSEATHTGEIRLAVESGLPWSYLWRNLPARARALMVFSKLRVWDTEQNNGVLIYVALADQAIEIVADRGIARHVPPAEWEAICAIMREQFRSYDFEGGARECIYRVGEKLRQHFGLKPGEENPDQLANEPTVL